MDISKYFKNYFQPLEIPEQAKKGYGHIEVAPKPEDWHMGGGEQARKLILSPDRDYTNYLPIREYQSKNGFDTYSCVVFSGLNAIEIYFKKAYGLDFNFSDRYIASLIPVTPYRGTTYEKFWDTVRKYGLVLEEDYPWTDEKTPKEYFKTPPQEIIEKGKLFLQAWDIEHEWIDYNGVDPEKLYDALQFCPPPASVNAEATYTGKRVVGNINHSISIVKGIYKKSWTILDHYSRETYEVPWNFYFGSAKGMSILKKKEIELVKVWNDPKVYAVFGATACHIANEPTWQYGAKLGIWSGEGSSILVYTQDTFNKKFTIGESIIFE